MMQIFESNDKVFIHFYRRCGYVHLTNVFSQREVEDFRKTCRDLWNRFEGKTGDLLSYPELRHVALDDRLLNIARDVLGENVVYFGDSSFAVNYQRDRHLHRDARDDREDPSMTSYPILRLGIYLQDHSRYSDGLKVRPGSQKSVFWTTRNFLRLFLCIGREERIRLSAFKPTWFYNVPTQSGDVVLWNLRTHHAGHAVRLRKFPNLAFPPKIDNVIPQAFQEPAERERVTLFMSLGAPSLALDRYIAERARTVFNQDFWHRCHFDDPEVLAMCKAKGLTVRSDVLFSKKESLEQVGVGR